MADLPRTSTRLSACLSLIAVHQTGDSALPFDLGGVRQLINSLSNPASVISTNTLKSAANLALNVGEYAASWTTIGAVMGMEISQESTPIGRGGMNSSIEYFGMLPGKITTTLSIEKTLLYYEDALSAFQFMPGNIALQTTPLIIIENIAVPDSPEIQKRFGSFARKIGTAASLGVSDFGMLQPNIYVGCRISGSRTKYDINSADQMVVQNITMSVARVVNPAAEMATQEGRLLGGIFGEDVGNAVAGSAAVLATNVPIINKIV